MFRKFVLALVFATFGGCAQDEAARYYAREKYTAKPVEQVEVLQTAPKQPYDVIADFQARNVTVDGMRRKAAAIGADAVIISLLGGYRAQADEWASDNSYGQYYSRIVATAIRYK